MYALVTTDIQPYDEYAITNVPTDLVGYQT